MLNSLLPPQREAQPSAVLKRPSTPSVINKIFSTAEGLRDPAVLETPELPLTYHVKWHETETVNLSSRGLNNCLPSVGKTLLILLQALRSNISRLVGHRK